MPTNPADPEALRAGLADAADRLKATSEPAVPSEPVQAVDVPALRRVLTDLDGARARVHAARERVLEIGASRGVEPPPAAR